MRLANVQAGDVVEANVRGFTFRARILDLDDPLIEGKPIHVEPLVGGVTYFHLAASQIVRRLDPPPRKHRRQGATT